MANKRKTSAPVADQIMMFDVPAVKQVYNEPASKVKVDADVSDISNIGLNAVYEGRSETYSSIGDYIRKNNIVR